MCPAVVIGRFLPGRCRFESILMTFQKSTCPDGRKKRRNVFRIDTTSSWISSQQRSVLPNKKHMWVKKMLSRLGELDPVSLTWLSFSTPRPTRFIHLSWLNHTKDRVGAVRRALIWHFPHYPAGRFLCWFFFAPAWFSQFTPLWLLVQRVWRPHNSQLWSIQQRSGVWGITEEPFKTRVERHQPTECRKYIQRWKGTEINDLFPIHFHICSWLFSANKTNNHSFKCSFWLFKKKKQDWSFNGFWLAFFLCILIFEEECLQECGTRFY